MINIHTYLYTWIQIPYKWLQRYLEAVMVCVQMLETVFRLLHEALLYTWIYINIYTLYVGNLSTTWTEIIHFDDVLPRGIPLWEPELLPLPLLPWVRMSPSLSRVRSAEYLLYCSTGVPALPSARLSRLAAKDAGALIWPLPTSFRYYQNTKSKIDLLHQEIYAAL